MHPVSLTRVVVPFIAVMSTLAPCHYQSVSPALLTAKNLELAVPGTYAVNQEVVQIQGFAPSLDVISSKQRPRKITLYGLSLSFV